MTLGILTAIWRRPELTELMLRHTASLDVERVCVRSPEDPEPCKEVSGWTYCEAPNKPLSEKWTKGLSIFRQMDVDAVMILGSDDFVNAALIERIKNTIETHDSDFIQPGGLWVYDALNGDCIYGEAQRIGAGRVLSRKLLDILDWRPWNKAELGKLDHAMEDKLTPLIIAPYRLMYMPNRGEVMVDVKTQSERSDRQAWTFKDLEGIAIAKYDAQKFWEYHFPEIAQDILNLQHQEV